MKKQQQILLTSQDVLDILGRGGKHRPYYAQVAGYSVKQHRVGEKKVWDGKSIEVSYTFSRKQKFQMSFSAQQEHAKMVLGTYQETLEAAGLTCEWGMRTGDWYLICQPKETVLS